MRLTVFAAAFTFVLWGTPAFAQDFDGDGFGDAIDNCSLVSNSAQDDTDGDDCGNLCDADYDGNGAVGFPDFGEIVDAYGGPDAQKCHVEPIPGCVVGFPDFGFLVATYAFAPGPSGTTAGTTACPTPAPLCLDCAFDIDGNGQVDVNDLNECFNCSAPLWCGIPACENWDLDMSGTVSFNDFGQFVLMGPCPHLPPNFCPTP
jgi:hypothetical protein